MATMDDDLMSSPDPLNDSVPSSLMRRMTRSQQSKQFMSLGGASVSPRRQTFALEVGDNRSPQKLFVTVESEQQQQQSSAVRRRLFASPTPKKTPTQRRTRTTTTTTIPLRDPSDDEGISAIASATPKKRGRPRKYAPTPLPGASSKKRAGTPARKGTPGRPRKNAALTEEASSEASAQPTPRSSRARRTATGKEPASDATVEATPASTQSKRGAKRKAVDETPSSAPASSPKKRGRPRKKPLVVEELQEVPEEQDLPQAPSPVPTEPSPAPLQSDPARPTSPIQSADNIMPPSEGDIWMDTLSNEATPRPLARSRSFNTSANTADLPNHSPEAPGAFEEIDEYAPMAEARDDTPPPSGEDMAEHERPESDVDDVMLVTKPVNDAASEAMSEVSHPGVDRRIRDHDTIAQSEEFSMIFMESVRSLHPDTSAMANASTEPSNENEIGDDTNLFINKTLESIKNGMQSEAGDGSEHNRSDRSASDNDQQDGDGEEQQEQRASSHYELSQHGTEPEPEVIRYEEPKMAEEVAEEYQTQDHPSHHEASEQEMELGSEHYVDGNNGDDGDLAEEYYSREQSSPRNEPYQQDAEHASAHAEDEDDQGLEEEYETQAPDWDADEPEVPTSPSRQPPAEPQPETSPTKNPLSPWWSGSPRRTKPLPLGRQLLSFKAMQSHSPSQAHFSPSHGSRRNSAGPGEESNLYEDSFSEIPEEVLEAATPRPRRTAIPSSNQSPAVHPGPQSKDAAASGVSGATDTIRSDASRMLTPEETPSPTADEVGGSNLVNTSVIVSDPISARSKSASPSRVTHPGQSFLAPRRPVQDEVTPVGPASSPQLPALHDANAHRVTQSSEHDRRLTLSPIVRAGLALQSVTSDQSSPLGPKTLGSPFKASAHSTPRRGSAQPSREMEQTADSQPNTRQPETMPSDEDPFRRNRRSSGQDPFMRALDETARQMQTQRTSQPNSVYDTTQATINDADEMSWVAEDTIPAPMPQDAVASRSSSMAGNFGSVAGRQNSVRNEEAGNGEIDDEDIWVTEAQRPTPKQPRQQAFGPAQRARRTLLPNTWRRNSQATPAAKTAMDNRADQSQEEYSLLSQQSKETSMRQGSSAMKQGAAGGLDLSKFFSSPTVLPTLDGAKHPAEKNVPANREAPAPARTLPSNSMFPAVPQKDFQPSPVRRSRLFSSAASASAATSVPEQQSSPMKSVGTNMAEQQASPSKSMATSVVEQQTAPSTPERPAVPVVEQKQNFTPRRGQGSQSLFAPRSAHSSAPTPPQMQLSRNDIERWQEETSLVLDQSTESPEAQREPPGPLPHRTMSPSKSCLRSPLKPRTPGRVVEFAGAVSPLQEARARAANANANPRRVPPLVQFKPPQPKQARAQPIVLEEDKENSPSDVSMSDVSPQKAPLKAPLKAPQKAKVSEGLSQKVWSRDHWRLLDTLLQLRRKGPFPFNLEAAGYVPRERGLVGKLAASGGESMEIEKWHIDVVDAFRAEVGGWDEGALAKRVFALLVGERKRYG